MPQNTRGSRDYPLTGGFIADGTGVLPSAEDAAPLGRIPMQVLDWLIRHGHNAISFAARYAAGIATITDYDDAGLAAGFEVMPQEPPR